MTATYFDPTINDRTTGKRGFVWYGKYEDDYPPQTFLPITAWRAKVKKQYKDRTDSRQYDPGIGLIYSRRKPIAIEVEATIEGWFRINLTPYTLIAAMFNGLDLPARIELWIDDQNRMFNGLWTIHDPEFEFPLEDMATFRANLRSYSQLEIGGFNKIAPDDDPGFF